jgi:hypothetical protein
MQHAAYALTPGLRRYDDGRRAQASASLLPCVSECVEDVKTRTLCGRGWIDEPSLSGPELAIRLGTRLGHARSVLDGVPASSDESSLDHEIMKETDDQHVVGSTSSPTPSPRVASKEGSALGTDEGRTLSFFSNESVDVCLPTSLSLNRSEVELADMRGDARWKSRERKGSEQSEGRSKGCARPSLAISYSWYRICD